MKIIYRFSFILLFLFLLVSCSSSDINDQNSTDYLLEKTQVLNNQKKTINIANTIRNFDKPGFIISNIKNYPELNAKYNILKEYNYTDDVSAYNEIKSKIFMDIMANEGPDILFFDNNFFNSINKIMDNNYFIDLNIYLNDKSKINMEDYLQSIMNSTFYQEKRKFIPLYFDIGVFSILEDTAKEIGINTDTVLLGLDQFSNATEKFNEINNGEKDFLYQSIQFSDYLLSTGINYIDYSKKISSFSSNSFLQLVEEYKNKLVPNFPKGDYSYSNNMCNFIGADGNAAVLRCREFFLLHHKIINVKENNKEILVDNRLLKGTGPGSTIIRNYEIETQPIYHFTMPLKNNRVSSPYVNYFAGISSKCKNPDEAFEFIKKLLSLEYQATILYDDEIDTNFYFTRYPVNIKAYERDKYIILNSSLFDPEIEKPIDEVYYNMGDAVLYDSIVLEKINEYVGQYIEGRFSLNQVGSGLDEFMKIYLNE